MGVMKQILLFLSAMFFYSCSSESEVNAQTTMDKIYITIGEQTQSVTLIDNAATKALLEKLQQAPVHVTLNSSGGFEIWGALGFSLPQSPPPSPPRGRVSVRMAFSSPRGGREGAWAAHFYRS